MLVELIIGIAIGYIPCELVEHSYEHRLIFYRCGQFWSGRDSRIQYVMLTETLDSAHWWFRYGTFYRHNLLPCHQHI
jgi:hypothetical protein